MENIELKCDINKFDDEHRLVFAWASVISENGVDIVDSQGDIISEEELELAAYDYVLYSREGGEMHAKMGVARLVESMVFTKSKQDAMGIDLGKVGWFVGFKIQDEDVWQKIKSGEYPMLSIGGSGLREDVEDET